MNARTAAGRGRFIGGGVPQSPTTLATKFPPAAFEGFFAACSDGRARYCDGTSWKTVVDEALAAEIAEDVAANVVRVLEAATEVTVGAGGDFATLSEALAYFASFLVPPDIPFPAAQVRILTGTVMQEQVELRAVPLNFVRVIADDETVLVDPTFLTKFTAPERFGSTSTDNYHAFIHALTAGPEFHGFRFVLDTGTVPMDPDFGDIGDPYTPRPIGFQIDTEGSIVVTPREVSSVWRRAGAEGFYMNAAVEGRLLADAPNFSNATHWGIRNRLIGIIRLSSAIIRGCTTRAIRSSARLVIDGPSGIDKFADYSNDFRCNDGDPAYRDVELIPGSVYSNFTTGTVLGRIEDLELSLYNGDANELGIVTTGVRINASTTNVAVAEAGAVLLNWPATGTQKHQMQLRQGATELWMRRFAAGTWQAWTCMASGVAQPLPIYTVATVPAAAANTGRQIYVSNGAAGQPVVAFSNGTNWLRCDTRANISA
jgi:hypothetical protein